MIFGVIEIAQVEKYYARKSLSVAPDQGPSHFVPTMKFVHLGKNWIYFGPFIGICHPLTISFRYKTRLLFMNSDH